MFHVHRLLLNLLSVFLSFLDHTDSKTHRHYGRRSAVAMHWKQARDPSSNQSFAYRVVRYLRDYAQHVDIPRISRYRSEGELSRLQLNPEDFLDDFSRAREQWKLGLERNLLCCPTKSHFFPFLCTGGMQSAISPED